MSQPIGSMSGAAFREVLIVDSNSDRRARVGAELRPLAGRLELSDGARTACDRLERQPVELLLLDAALPEGGTFKVIDAAFRMCASPIIIALGERSDDTTHVFELARVGVHAYLPRPISAAHVLGCVAEIRGDLAPIRNLLRGYVGRFGLKDIQAYVRQAVVREALARTGGSRRSAARMLGVTRPAVQKFLRELGLDP